MIRPATPGGTCLRTSLTGYFSSEVTIIRATMSADAYGDMIAAWDVVPEHCDIAAFVAGGDVSAGIRMKKQEFRTSSMVHEMEYRRVLLEGEWPAIDHKDRARFDGRDWAIVAIVIDPTKTYTELLCESLEPGAL